VRQGKDFTQLSLDEQERVLALCLIDIAKVIRRGLGQCGASCHPRILARGAMPSGPELAGSGVKGLLIAKFPKPLREQSRSTNALLFLGRALAGAHLIVK